MAEKEGVIKFSLDHRTTTLGHEIQTEVEELIIWRDLCRRLGFLGQDPKRYHGYGFGNISRRLDGQAFLISASQTSGILEAKPEHVSMVTTVNLEQNHLISKGQMTPSSESMTHAALFSIGESVNWVIHSHSPEIWRFSHELELPFTEECIPYGTPEMAVAVQQLYLSMPSRTAGIFVMKGHEDGVVSYGSTALEAMELMQGTLSDALLLQGGYRDSLDINSDL